MQIEEAVTLVKARIRKTGQVASDVVRNLWRKKLTFDKETLDLLAQEGLRSRVNSDMHEDRSFAGQLREIRVIVTDQDPRHDVSNILVSVMYQNDTGKMVALINFTKDDFQRVAIWARGKAMGFMAVAHFMERGHKVLDQHNARHVHDLPKDVQVMLAEKWPRS